MHKHPDLSRVKLSATKVFESWIKDLKIEKECKSDGIDIVKNKILEQLESTKGTCLSEEKYRYYELNFKKQKTPKDLMLFIWHAEASGENNGVI